MTKKHIINRYIKNKKKRKNKKIVKYTIQVFNYYKQLQIFHIWCCMKILYNNKKKNYKVFLKNTQHNQIIKFIMVKIKVEEITNIILHTVFINQIINIFIPKKVTVMKVLI